MRNISKLSFLGACFTSGQPIQGVELGPRAIRNSGIFKSLQNKYHVAVSDHGDVKEVKVKDYVKHKSHIGNLDILDPSLKSLNDKVTQIISNMNDQNQLLLTVGGDHSIASGTIHGLLSKYNDLKVIWVDAHGDIIDAHKSQYEGYHGMPLAHLIGVNDGKIPGFQWFTRRLNPKNVVHIGLRDVDHDQWETLRDWKIKCFTPDHIDMLGIGEVMRQAIQYLDPSPSATSSQNPTAGHQHNKHHHNKNTKTAHNSAPFHISFDIDALDPAHAEATGTKYRGGLTHRQACHIVRRTCWERKVVSMDLVEINPGLQQINKKRKKYRGEEHYDEHLSSTVGMGVDLIDSLFKTYLKL